MQPQREIRHEWHTFDELKGYDVRRQNDIVQVATPDERIVTLDLDEFDKLRGTGAKPGGLE